MITDIRKHYRFSSEDAVVAEVCPGCWLACLEPRQTLPAGRLPSAPLLCYVLEGTALFVRGQQQDYVSAGGLLRSEVGQELSIGNGGVGRLAVMIIPSFESPSQGLVR